MCHRVPMQLLLGIGVHHASILVEVRNAVETLFTEGKLGVLFATSTVVRRELPRSSCVTARHSLTSVCVRVCVRLHAFALVQAQGSNLPCKSVVMTASGLLDANLYVPRLRVCLLGLCAALPPAPLHLLPTFRFRQACGRAGRRGKDRRGRVLLLLPTHSIRTLATTPLSNLMRPEPLTMLTFGASFGGGAPCGMPGIRQHFDGPSAWCLRQCASGCCSRTPPSKPTKSNC